MEISVLSKHDTGLVLALKGRLDAYWAEDLAKNLEEAVRGGARELRLDMSEVSYISSMGIRVLTNYYQKLAAIEGTFAISDPSAQVEKILDMTGVLDQLLAPASPVPASTGALMTRVERESAVYELAASDPSGEFVCRAVGDPSPLPNAGFQARHCRAIAFPETSVAVGLGAFGSGFEDSRKRFGEFLAAAGSAAYQPTDGSNVADYMESAEKLVPEVQVLYALACNGKFSHHIRFAAKDEHAGIGLTRLLSDCLELAGARRAAVVMVAESTGLLGAWLRHSPAAQADAGNTGTELYSHPGIRKWISYTPDRVHSRSLALIAGIVAATDAGGMAEFLRPMGNLQGHFHAAAFSYQPLKSGPLNVHETVQSLFDAERLQGVLHLLCDDRAASGAGESEFLRGAVWMGPITEVVREDASR